MAVATTLLRLPPLFLLLLLTTATTLAAADDDGSSRDDAAALVRLKESLTDPTGALDAWSASSPTPPCDEAGAGPRWPGVQCYKGALAGLRLARMNLSGTFDFAAIASLPGLHSVNLNHNAFTGPLPPSLATARGLRAVYLSHNAFTGPVPAELFAGMRWLKKLYLDHNDLTGVLPADALADAPRLLELHLEYNRIEGPVPEFLPATLHALNLSHNLLTGVVPRGVASRYDASSFAGNPGLCGAPGSDADACAAIMPVPSPMPPPSPEDALAVQEETSVLVVIGIILVVILLVTGAMVLMLRQDERNAPAWDYPGAGAGVGKPVSLSMTEAEMVAVDVATSGSTGAAGSSTSSSQSGGGGRRMGEFVLVRDDIPPFGLPELMKASAEVLGNGTLGSAYKAAMRNGVTVAVKRMRDMNRVGRVEFEQHLLMLSELRHPNVLPPIGYHYRKEEKLIVSEYMPRGSLLYVLHGDQSPNRVVLDWPARLRVAVGVARGMAFLHEKLGIPAGRLVSMDGADFDAPPPPPPHGNLKSGNVLLDGDTLEPRVVDYGFFPLVNPAQAPQAMFAFRSPEGATRGVVSPRSDVYCLGVVLLELVTGRFPSQYLTTARGGTDVVHWSAAAVAEGGERGLVDPAVAAAGGDAAVRLLRVGVHCASAEPECRPSMPEAARMVEEIAAGVGAS